MTRERTGGVDGRWWGAIVQRGLVAWTVVALAPGVLPGAAGTVAGVGAGVGGRVVDEWQPGGEVIAAPGRLAIGSGDYVFDSTEATADRPVTVWYHIPEGLEPDAPVVIVMHGALRNGRSYRNAWVSTAEENGFVLVLPEFSAEHYPGARAYNLGNVIDARGNTTPRGRWTYPIVEDVFDDFVARAGKANDGYHIFGHSAGSQFVHRFLLFVPEARARRVVLANAGWYTQPTPLAPFPFGIGNPRGDGVLVTDDILGRYFEREVLVLLGERDNDPEANMLRRDEEVDRQGTHRLERGRNFFRVAGEEAERLGVELGWRLETVPGVAHSNAGVAPAAAAFMCE